MFPVWLIEILKALAAIALIAFGMGAKVLDPLRSSEARGRVGGTIYNTSRGVKYVKSFTSPAQPRTALQLAMRAFMQTATRAWSDITGPNRIAWNNYGAANPEIDWTGQPLRKSGFNWFCRLTSRLLWRGFAQVDTPPAVAAPDALLVFAAANGVASSVLTWTATPGTDITAVIYRVGPHSAGLTAKRERATFSAAATGETGTITVTGLSPGTHTFFAYAMDETNGLISTMVRDSATIT